ncbi:MAG: hypothetical protein ACTSRA_16550 [Promethearchaeota archaeon]
MDALLVAKIWNLTVVFGFIIIYIHEIVKVILKICKVIIDK